MSLVRLITIAGTIAIITTIAGTTTIDRVGKENGAPLSRMWEGGDGAT